MKWNLATNRMLALTAAVLVAAGTAMVVGTPRGVDELVLGADWQCSRTMLFVTTCVH